MFADDATFAMDGSLKTFQKLMYILDEANQISGLKLILNKGTRQFIDKTTHGFWRQFTDTIEDNSSTLFEDNSPTNYYVEIIPKLIK